MQSRRQTLDIRAKPARFAAMDKLRADSPYDPHEDAPVIAKGPAAKPKDAATLILTMTEAGALKVLMGRRAKGHVFMPDKWVFPGGRIDRSDGYAPAASELCAEALAFLTQDRSEHRARACALAAIRETYEETGLIIGQDGGAASRSLKRAPKGWEEFLQTALPHLEPLMPVARAITPPHRPRRFDARFFVADAERALLDDRPLGGSGELEELRWFSLDEALALDLPSITHFVLHEIKARHQGEAEPGCPFVRFHRGRHILERIGES